MTNNNNKCIFKVTRSKGRDKYMVIFEYAKCDTCRKKYKGKFKVKPDGKLECVSCKDIEKVEGVKYQKLEDKSSEVTQEIVKELLKRDLNRIYLLRGEEEVKKLRDENGGIDPKKLYFQNNNIELVMELHQAAYQALTYLEMGEGLEYRRFAQEVYNTYMNARYKKYNKEEEVIIWSLIRSKEMEEVSREVEVKSG